VERTAQQRRAGLFTSEELPRGMCRALADGIAASDRKVLLIASGALSHTFSPLRELRDHEAGDPEHIATLQARQADEERIAWFERGRHEQVLGTMPEFWTHKPEARFYHYLMMIGALGEAACTAPGRRYSAYENSIGTGQIHLWFDRPAGGWTAPRTGAGPLHDPHHHVDPHLEP
jgi:3,4-dihydroxyphenylacetate 2,3-dioxygenase